MKTIVTSVFLFVLALGQLLAQSSSSRFVAKQNHVWGSATAAIDLSQYWILHIEYQERRADSGEDIQQHLARVGLLRRLDDKHLLGGGYAFVHTAAYGELPAKFPFDEHRAWLQFQSKEQLKSLGLTHRYRFEFRHIDPTHTSRNEFRIRYLLRMQHPIVVGAKHQFYGVFFDEVFVNMGKKIAYNIFDQNRAALLLGFSINKRLNIEAGYLNQYLMQRNLNAEHQNKIENNHTALITLAWNGPWHSPNRPNAAPEKQ